LTFACFIAQLAVVVLLLQSQAGLSEQHSSKYSSDMRDKFEKRIVNFAEEKPSTWVKVQDSWDCCGYNSTVGGLATGGSCMAFGNQTLSVATMEEMSKEDGITACRVRLLEFARQNMAIVGAAALLLALVEFVACYASFVLLVRKGKRIELVDALPFHFRRLVQPSRRSSRVAPAGATRVVVVRKAEPV
jgi:hypothetical protein